MLRGGRYAFPHPPSHQKHPSTSPDPYPGESTTFDRSDVKEQQGTIHQAFFDHLRGTVTSPHSQEVDSIRIENTLSLVLTFDDRGC